MIQLFILILLLSSSVSGLTIFSINLANYNDHPNWPIRMRLIADAIVAVNPDVIALQEPRFDPDYPTTTSTYQNAAEQVLYTLNRQGAYLGARIVTQPIMYYPTTSCVNRVHESHAKLRTIRQAYSSEHQSCIPLELHEGLDAAHIDASVSTESSYEYPLPGSLAPCNQTLFWEGIAIISKLPIEETGTRFLTKTNQCTDVNLRATQYISFSLTSSQRFYLFNTHFGLDVTCQSDNAAETASFIKNIGSASDMKLLVGDLNALPTTPALSILTQSGLTDIWALLQPNTTGYTYPSNAPIKRIDYMLGNSIFSQSVKTINQTCTQPNDQGIYPSDHFGLISVVVPNNMKIECN